jgi:3-hydroxyacyl-CoA dehydrogenase
MADLKKVGVLGAGTMGNGIAQVFAQAGVGVALVDLKTEYLDRALGTIEKNLRRVAKKKELDGDAFSKECLDRIAPSIQLEDIADADIVVEAVVEDAGIKLEASSPPTPARSASPRSPPRPPRPSASSACTSSTPSPS